MALEDIGAAVTGFSTGFGLMNDWEKQKLAVERERRLAEQAASQEQFRRLGLTRDIIGEYREDAPAVLQATGLPVPDPGLMGVFQRATAKEQEAADYVMNPSRRGTQFPSLSPKHPLWPEVRAAVAEERKRAMQAQEGQAAAQAYEEGAGGIGGEQLTQPMVTSPVFRSALARARMGDRKLLDTLQEGQVDLELQRQLQENLPSGAGRLEPSFTIQKGKLTTRLVSPRDRSTQEDRDALQATLLARLDPDTPEGQAYALQWKDERQRRRTTNMAVLNAQAEIDNLTQQGVQLTPTQIASIRSKHASQMRSATLNTAIYDYYRDLALRGQGPAEGTPEFAQQVAQAMKAMERPIPVAQDQRLENPLDVATGAQPGTRPPPAILGGPAAAPARVAPPPQQGAMSTSPMATVRSDSLPNAVFGKNRDQLTTGEGYALQEMVILPTVRGERSATVDPAEIPRIRARAREMDSQILTGGTPGGQGQPPAAAPPAAAPQWVIVRRNAQAEIEDRTRRGEKLTPEQIDSIRKTDGVEGVVDLNRAGKLKAGYTVVGPAPADRVPKTAPAPAAAAAPAQANQGPYMQTDVTGDQRAPGYVKRAKEMSATERQDFTAMQNKLGELGYIIEKLEKKPELGRTFGTALQTMGGSLRRTMGEKLPVLLRDNPTYRLGMTQEERALVTRFQQLNQEIKHALIGATRTVPELLDVGPAIPDLQENDVAQILGHLQGWYESVEAALRRKGYTLEQLGVRIPKSVLGAVK